MELSEAEIIAEAALWRQEIQAAEDTSNVASAEYQDIVRGRMEITKMC